jgi:hypothetical protein
MVLRIFVKGLKWFSSVTPDEYQDKTNKTAALKTVHLIILE